MTVYLVPFPASCFCLLCAVAVSIIYNVDIVYTLSYLYIMNIIWDDEKNEILIAERGISFELVVELIMQKEYIAILENPSRKGQYIFILPIDGYIHVVPFVIDGDDNIVLKTVFPSRKFHNLYGEKGHEKKTR